MVFLPKQLLASLKRVAAVSIIALATNGSPNKNADLMPAPALPVATLQVPKKLRFSGGATFATDTTLSGGPPIG
jgi:hypothetical protein